MAVQQLTLNQTVKLIREIAQSHNQINTIYFGDIWEFLAQPDNVYPAMFFSLTGSSIAGKNLAMDFSLFFLDRQLQDETNETDVLSDQLLIGQDVYSMMRYPKFDWKLEENVAIDFFTENEKDYLAGVKLDITINYPMMTDRCQVPSSFSYPDYVASVSGNGGSVSYVKFLVDYPTYSSLPTTGDPGKIYVTNDTNIIYRWVDTVWVAIKTNSSVNWGSIAGTLSAQTDLQNALNAKYNASNPSGYISGITSSNVTTALGFTPESNSNKGVANGYASLDGSGLVPSTQLPSYVDDVLEYTNLASFPATGTTGKIYVDLATNKIYRWSGSTYIEVSPSVGTAWGGITGTLSNQTDLQTALNAKQSTIILSTNNYAGVSTLIGSTLNIPNYGGGFTSIAASASLFTLTVNSPTENYISGSGGQTIKLPDATTLANGTTFSFNNNQSSGAVLVNNNSNTLIVSIPSGGYTDLMLIDNSIAAGNWDKHFSSPSNVSWSTNTFDYAGSVTSATWNGVSVAPNRGGTGQSTYTDGQLLIGNSTGNTLSKATLTAGSGISITNGSGTITIASTITQYADSNARSAISLTTTGSSGASTYNSSTGVLNIPSYSGGGSGTVTSVAALTLGTTGTDLTSTVANGTTTPVITLNVPTASASNRGVLSSADWTTFNGKQGALTLTTTGTSGAATLVGNTLNIPNYASGGGSGTVTSVSVTTANGISGSVATSTTTPAITLTLGAITPTTVNGVTISGSTTPTLAITGTSSISGANTGDNAINSLYSGLVSNATHTGDATGSTALTVVALRGVALPTLGATAGLLKYTGTGTNTWVFDSTAYGTGSVTSVSVASANGFAGSVATNTTTPAITISTSISGLLKGNGTAISAATAGTDYLVSVGIANLTATGTPSATTYLRGDNTWATVTGGSATPGGSSGQVQYNNASTFAGASYVNIGGSGILQLLDVPSIPSAPSASTMYLYAEDHAGKTLPVVMSPTGIDYNLQAALYGVSTYMWLAGTGTTVGINWGTSFTALNVATGAAQSTPTKASTNIMTSMNRANFSTGSTTAGSSGIVSASTVAWLGNAAGLGGFLFFARFGLETVSGTYTAFCGLVASTSSLAAEASTLANQISVGKDSTDTTWQIITRSATTLTKTNTAITVTAGQVLDVYIHSAPNTSSVKVHIKDASNGSDLYVSSALTANLPANTTFLNMRAEILSVSGTTPKLLALNRMYLETDI